MIPSCDYAKCSFKAAYCVRFYKDGMNNTVLVCGRHVLEEESWRKQAGWERRIKVQTGRR